MRESKAHRHLRVPPRLAQLDHLHAAGAHCLGPSSVVSPHRSRLISRWTRVMQTVIGQLQHSLNKRVGMDLIELHELFPVSLEAMHDHGKDSLLQQKRKINHCPTEDFRRIKVNSHWPRSQPSSSRSPPPAAHPSQT